MFDPFDQPRLELTATGRHRLSKYFYTAFQNIFILCYKSIYVSRTTGSLKIFGKYSLTCLRYINSKTLRWMRRRFWEVGEQCILSLTLLDWAWLYGRPQEAVWSSRSKTYQKIIFYVSVLNGGDSCLGFPQKLQSGVADMSWSAPVDQFVWVSELLASISVNTFHTDKHCPAHLQVNNNCYVSLLKYWCQSRKKIHSDNDTDMAAKATRHVCC